MKKFILAAAVAGFAMAATPALADNYGVSGYDVNVGNVHASAGQSLDVNIDNTLSASSGSGFGGDIKVNGLLNGNLINGGSIATFSGAGTAWSIAGGLEGYYSAYPVFGADGGVAGSISSSSGGFTATAVNNASVDGQVMNFGQSDYTKSFTFDYHSDSDFTFNDSNTLSISGWATGTF
jgi:hypothetical protein